MSWLDNITHSMGMSLSKLRQVVNNEETWHAAVHEVTISKTLLSYWAELMFVDG